MSFFGKLLNVAGVGVNLLSSIVNGSSLSSDSLEYHYVLEDGKRVSILAQYIATATDPALIGQGSPVMRPSERSRLGITQPVLPAEAVAFTSAADDSGNQIVYAVNTSTTYDFWIFWALTLPNGNTNNNQTHLTRATNVYKPNLVDITGYFGDYGTGNFVVTPVQIYPSPLESQMMKYIDPTNAAPIEPDTLLGNFGINSVFAAAFYFLYTAQDNTSIKWTWVTDNTNAIVGAKITSTVAYAVNISGTLTWENPGRAFTVNFVANPVSVNGGITVYDFPASNRPLVAASISAIQPASTSAQRKALLEDFQQKELKKGKVKTIKYMIV